MTGVRQGIIMMHYSTLIYLAAFLTLVCCSNSNCKEGDFACTDGKCIPQDFMCDGVYDCRDGKDEDTCEEIHRAAIDLEPVEADAPVFPLEFGDAKPIEDKPAAPTTDTPPIELGDTTPTEERTAPTSSDTPTFEVGNANPADNKPRINSIDTPTLVEEIEPANSGAQRIHMFSFF